MQLGDLLSQERIRVPLRAESLPDAVTQLLSIADPDRGEPGEGDALLARLRSGEGGSVHRPTPDILVLVLRAGEGDASRGAMGVAPEPLDPGPGPEGEKAEPAPRVLILLRVTRSVPLGDGVMGRITGVLADPEVSRDLVNAETPLDVRSLRPLMAVELKERLKVEHVMVPLSYRVFPHTPLDEVVDLMSRKGLRALPVVGDDLQVLGIVTAGEALRYAVQKKSRGEVGEKRTKEVGGTARDVMIRSVMCVSEDEDLRNAARTMVNKDMGQLPVVREGEIVGILTRDAVLKALFGT
jgi:CBS domain-containing protein